MMNRVKLSYSYINTYYSPIITSISYYNLPKYCKYSNLISRSMIDKIKNDQKDNSKESQHKKFSLYGIDRDSKENKGVDLDKVYETVNTLENYCKFYVKSKGVDFVEHPDPPDSFLYKGEGTRILTPAIYNKYKKFSDETDQLIKNRNDDFKVRAFESIEKVLKLRSTHWGIHHPLSLSSTVIYLSMLEVAEDYDTLNEHCTFWLLYCDKHLKKIRKSIEKHKNIDKIDSRKLRELTIEDHQTLLYFYACVTKLLTDELVRRGEAKESLELAQIAMKHLSKNAKDNLVYIVLLGRNLANAYIELGKLEQAITVLELILDLQSTSGFSQSISNTFSIHEWIDPILERINTTIHIARLKLSNNEYDNAESYLRAALTLGIEHAGKYTSLACSIQVEILNLIKMNPDKTDEEFEQLYLISLDIAKETHKRIRKDIDSISELYEQKKLASSMPYVNLLKLGIRIFQYSKKHTNMYRKLLLEITKYWPEQEMDEKSPEYCYVSFSVVDYFLANGLYSKAIEVLYYANPIITNSFIDPSPTIAHYLNLQVKAQLLQDNPCISKHLPFIDSLDLSKLSKPKESYKIIQSLIAKSMSIVKRANNNQINPINFSVHLYNLAFTQIIYNQLDDAEANLFKILSLLVPEYIESESKIIAVPQKLDNDGLASLFNASSTLASLFLKSGRIDRALKYFLFSCKVAHIEKPLSDDPLNIGTLQLLNSRYSNIKNCLERIVNIQSEKYQLHPSDENNQLLEIYKTHYNQISTVVDETSTRLELFKDALNQIEFKSFEIPDKYSKQYPQLFNNINEEEIEELNKED